MATPTQRHEFEKALGDGEGQGNLVCCSPWGHKESDTTEQLNRTDNVVNTGCYRIVDISFGNFNPACDSSSLAFHMIYSEYKLDK